MNIRSAKTVERLLVAMEAYRYGLTTIFQLMRSSDTVRERVLRHLYNSRPNTNAWNKAVLEAIGKLEDLDAELRKKFPKVGA